MSKASSRDRAGMVLCGLFIVMGALALYHTKDMSPLGSVFPRTIASVMVLLSIAYIVRNFVRPRGAMGVEPWGSVGRRGALVAVMFVWALLLDKGGFLVTSAVMFLVLLGVANYDKLPPRRLAGYLAASAIVVAGLYSVFKFGLKVPLPAGMLF